MKPRTSGKSERHGVTIIWTLIILGTISAMLAALAGQVLTGRRLVERHEQQTQALWLARSGLELATARLLTNPVALNEEAKGAVPGSRISIKIQPEGTSKSTFVLSCDARVPTSNGENVVRTATRPVRRVADRNGVRIEAVPPAR